MRISYVRVRRYRCLKDLSVTVGDYTALVGPNGSGKSSVLYALDWFFNGGHLTLDDIHSTSADAGPVDGSEIDVEVTFGDLNDEDRRVLGKYGRGSTARFRRIWSGNDGKEKMIGNSRQGPGFAAIRSGPPIADLRALYREAREQHAGLSDMTLKEDILGALTSWEDDPANAHLLEEVEAVDASHMFGFNGEYVLARRVRMILIPASADIIGQVLTPGKSSAVSQLIGALTNEAVSVARTRWEEENEAQLAALSKSVRDGVINSTKAQAARVNGLLTTLVPGASVDFVPDVPAWSVKSDPFVQTDVIIDGERKDVSRQGHGIQRAVMISMLQALVPDEAAAKAALGDVAADVAEETLAEEVRRLPALIVGIEEPEIYQHPVRARHFARVLALWARRLNSQVVLATHSPYFILPEQFASVRRFRLQHGSSDVAATTVADVAAAAVVDPVKVERVVEKEIPRTYSEGFFADAVVFVEGDTDRVVLEILAERLGKSLDAIGTAVLAMGGKGNLKIPFALLELIHIPVYIVTDGDAQAAARRHPDDAVKQAHAAASHRKATEGLLAWLPPAASAVEGVLPFNWGDPTTITDRWCLFHDDLEAELAAWPEFQAAMATQAEIPRSKNVAAYRSAATDADLTGLPASLAHLIEALAAFGG